MRSQPAAWFPFVCLVCLCGLFVGNRRPSARIVAVIAPGDFLGGRYQVERVLGRGGMGYVVAARHLHLDQRVAIKLLLAEHLEEPLIVERFLREARASVRLRSEHVGRVFDAGRFDDGVPYLVMEYLEGHELAVALRTAKQLPVAVAD